MMDEKFYISFHPQIKDGLNGFGSITHNFEKFQVLISHHLLELNSFRFSVGKLFRCFLDIGQSIINIVIDSIELFCKGIISLRKHILSFLIRNMEEGIVDGISSFYFIVLLDGLINFLKLLVRNRVVVIHVWSFEINLREITLMVGESSSCEGYLLNFIFYNHVQNSFRTCFDVVSEDEIVADIPNFEVVGPSCKEEILFMENH